MAQSYVCVLVEREDWDNWLQASCPQLAQVEAMNESEAYDKFAEDRGFSTEEMKAGEEDGDIVIVIKEVSRWKR